MTNQYKDIMDTYYEQGERLLMTNLNETNRAKFAQFPKSKKKRVIYKLIQKGSLGF
jgi:hypothetical protein